MVLSHRLNLRQNASCPKLWEGVPIPNKDSKSKLIHSLSSNLSRRDMLYWLCIFNIFHFWQDHVFILSFRDSGLFGGDFLAIQ
jgi:hypothetical protein